MLELIVAGALGIAGHVKSRDFVQKRLRYTSWIEKPSVGVAAGVATAVVAAPLVAIIPFIGAGTAIALGIGVGTGVSLGAAKARSGEFPDE
jgi:uncharacterized protein (DUF2062 family)